MARPRALDDTKRREICALVSAGCGLDMAGRYVGCNAITIRREALRNPEFHEQLRQAELRSQISPLHAIRQAANKHWRAAAWILERIDPNRFGRRKPEQVDPDELDGYFEELFHIIQQEVDADTMLRISSGFLSYYRGIEHEFWASTKARRDLANRRRPTNPPTPAWMRNDKPSTDKPVEEARDQADDQPNEP